MKQEENPIWKTISAQLWVVWVAVIVWWLVIGALQWLRLQQHGFDALDLSIYSQLLWDLVHGHGLFSSIQGHNYFSDHVEPLLFVALPLFRLWQSPLLLLWLQTFCVGLAVFPLRRIGEYTFGKQRRNLPVIVFLLHLAIWNVVLSEFHVVAFAVPLFIWAICSYMEQDYGRFLLGISLATLVREDVGLVVIGFGLLALIRRRSIRWWLAPLLIGAGGIVLAHVIQTQVGAAGLATSYFPWLESLSHGHIAEAASILGEQFLRVTPYRLIAITILAFGVVVLLGWEWWIPVLPMLLLLSSTGRAVENIVISDHHGAALLPFFCVALCVGVMRGRTLIEKRWKDATLAVPAYIACVCAVLLLPWFTVWAVRPYATIHTTVRDTDRLEQRIGANDGVVASANLLPDLTNRAVLQNSWYVFKGHDELNSVEYKVSPEVQWVLFDTTEFVDFASKTEYLPEQANAFRSLLQQSFTPVDESGSVILFARGQSPTNDELERIVHVEQQPLDVLDDNANNSVFAVYGTPTLVGSVLTIQIQVRNANLWRALENSDNQRPILRIINGEQQMRLPLGYGFANAQISQPGDVITTTIQVPDRVIGLNRTVQIVGELVHPEGLFLARNQSTARKDTVRSIFAQTTVQGL